MKNECHSVRIRAALGVSAVLMGILACGSFPTVDPCETAFQNLQIAFSGHGNVSDTRVEIPPSLGSISTHPDVMFNKKETHWTFVTRYMEKNCTENFEVIRQGVGNMDGVTVRRRLGQSISLPELNSNGGNPVLAIVITSILGVAGLLGGKKLVVG